MKLSRRDFIHAGCTSAIISLTPHFLDVAKARSIHGSGAGATPTGNVNLGLSGIAYFNNVYPFINILKTSSERQVSNSNNPGVLYLTSIPEGATNLFGSQSTFGVYTDNDGEFLSPLPAGTSSSSRIVMSLGQGSVVSSGPANFFGKNFTIDWTNSTDWTIQLNISHADGSTTNVSGVTSPLTFTWPSDCVGVSLHETAGTLSVPPKNVRIYQTSLASRLAAGQIVDPDYAAGVAAGCVDFRCMDWMLTNSNKVVNGIGNLPSAGAISWGIDNSGTSYPVNNNTGGIAAAAIIDMAVRTNKQPWICLPDLIGSPKISQAIQSIDPVGGVTVTTFGPHSWANGDQFIVPAGFFGSIPYVMNATAYNSGSSSFTFTKAPVDNTPVIFGLILNGSADSSTYPTGITKGTVTYYTVNGTSTTCQIAATPGGSPITLTGSMSGTINVYQQGDVSAFGRNVILTSYAASVWTKNAHGFVNGQPLIFGIKAGFATDGSTYPTATGFSTGTANGNTVFVVNATANTFQVSLTVGGGPISFTGSMTGAINVWLGLAGNTFTVANSNPGANQFDLSGPGSNTFGFWGQMSNGFNAGNNNGLNGVTPYLFQPFDQSYITSAVAAFISPFQAGVPSNLKIIYEHVNEKWNSQFTSYHTNLNLALNKPALVNQWYASGYYMCAVAKAIYDAYGGTSAGKAKYYMLFSSNQTAGPSLLSAYTVPGALQYLSDIGSSLTLAQLFDFLTVTSYYGDSYGTNASAANIFASNGAVDPCTFNVGASTIAITAQPGLTVNFIDLTAVLGAPVKLHATSGSLPSPLVAGTVGTNSNANASALVVCSITGTAMAISQNVYGTPSVGAAIAGAGIPAGRTLVSGSGNSWVISGSPLSIPAGTEVFIGTAFTPGTGTIYYLVGSAPNFGLSLTQGGSPITLSGSATGTYTASYCTADVVYSLMQQSLSLNASNPGTYPTPWTFYAQSISDDVFDGRWTNSLFTITSASGGVALNGVSIYTGFWTDFLAVGKSLHGLGLLAYEGGDGNTANAGFELYNDPTWRYFQVPTEYGVGAGTNFQQMRTATAGLLYRTSQFTDVASFNFAIGSGNYGAQQYVGENSLRWQGVVTANAAGNAP